MKITLLIIPEFYFSLFFKADDANYDRLAKRSVNKLVPGKMISSLLALLSIIGHNRFCSVVS